MLELVVELVVVDGVLLLVVVAGPGPTNIQFIFDIRSEDFVIRKLKMLAVEIFKLIDMH